MSAKRPTGPNIIPLEEPADISVALDLVNVKSILEGGFDPAIKAHAVHLHDRVWSESCGFCVARKGDQVTTRATPPPRLEPYRVVD